MRAVFVHLALLGLLGCKVDVDFNNTRFRCADGSCPDGYECVEEVCVVIDGPGGDGGAGPDGGGGGPDGAVALVPCDEQFGAAPGYELCAEDADGCEFFHATGDGTQVTCDEVCPMFGGATCVDSFDSSVGEAQCTPDGAAEGCAVAHSSQICVCSRNAL